MKRKLLMVSFLALIVFIAGCANSGEQVQKNKTDESKEVVKKNPHIENELDFKKLFPNEEIRAYAEKMIGTKAPDFSFKNLKGDSVELSALKGKNVIVEIASTTCPACVKAYPEVAKFKALSKGEIEFLTIFPNETKADAEEFFKVNGYAKDLELIAGEGTNNMILDYQVQYTPTFLFIDKKGYIQFVNIGADVNEVIFSGMSDLAFKTNLTDKFNTTEEIELEVPDKK